MSIIGGISIAVDSDNKVHICEYDWELGRLWYFTNATGDWAKVDNASPTTNSIAVDSNDKVHISYYYDGTNGGFKYATNASGSWVATTVDSNVYVEYNSIKTDSNNKVHISYYDYTNHDLKYATNASDGWVTTTVDSNGDVGGYSSIAVDSNNKVHISYSDGTNGDLKYATNASSCTDNDSDGYAIEGGDCGVVDCNDSNPAVNPGATEINNNSIDDDCNPATPTVTTSGSGNNYPVPLFRASLSLNVNASSLGTGSLSYYYTRNRLYFVSTSITGITATGGIATITGAGKVNNVTGYTFTATITDGTPDAMGLEIKKSDGTVYYSAPSQNVSSGNYTVVGQ
ncbi:MAG: putative metal-binding motif-containing protein [Nitrospirae bacterium]|nr:putative metal-binding motif-containing protein [Nitrospirota bacterium]